MNEALIKADHHLLAVKLIKKKEKQHCIERESTLHRKRIESSVKKQRNKEIGDTGGVMTYNRSSLAANLSFSPTTTLTKRDTFIII